MDSRDLKIIPRVCYADIELPIAMKCDYMANRLFLITMLSIDSSILNYD